MSPQSRVYVERLLLRRDDLRDLPARGNLYTGMTPLHFAAMSGMLETVRFLVDAGAQQRQDRGGRKPLDVVDSNSFVKADVAAAIRALLQDVPMARGARKTFSHVTFVSKDQTGCASMNADGRWVGEDCEAQRQSK